MIRLFAHVAAHVLRGEPLDNKVIAEGVAAVQEVLGPGETILARAAAAAKLIQAAAAVKAQQPAPGVCAAHVAPQPAPEEPPIFHCVYKGCPYVAVYGIFDVGSSDGGARPTHCTAHAQGAVDPFKLVRMRGHAGDLDEIFPSPELGVTA